MRAKCQYCGTMGESGSNCVSCGAIVEPARVKLEPVVLPPKTRWPLLDLAGAAIIIVNGFKLLSVLLG